MKKIAVMGARGFVGHNLTEHLKNKYEVLPITRDNFNLLDEKAVELFLEQEQPEVVINCTNQGGNRKVEAAGKPIDVIERDTDRDNYMTAQEALEYGLIDSIIENRK